MPDSNNNELIGFIARTVENMRDQMATKSDVARLAAQGTAIRGDIEQVQLRLDGIEHSACAVPVYLLGKDRPEVLRLLGRNGG